MNKRYRLLKKIKNNHRLVGYQLLTDSGSLIVAHKHQVLQLAKLGKIINVQYNTRTNSLSGSNGTDLRKLPTINSNMVTIPENNSTNTYINNTANEIERSANFMSNHKKAAAYELKCKLTENKI